MSGPTPYPPSPCQWGDYFVMSPTLPAADPEARAQALLAQAASQAAVKKGLLMKSLRAALLGSLQGPDLVTTWRLLHRSGEDRPRLQSSSSIP